MAVWTEVAHDDAFEPRPRAFHGIELRGVGGQADQRQPVRRLVDELARGHAAVRVDAIPDDDQGATVVLMQALEAADDVLGANGAGHQAEKEARATSVGRVGQRSDR